MKSAVEVWNKVLDSARKTLNPQSYKTWFEPIKPVSLQEESLVIQVPNRFFYEFLEEHYVNELRLFIKRELGDKGKLEYQILPEIQPAKKKQASQSYDLLDGDAPMNSGLIQNPFIIPGIRKQKIESQLNPNYKFQNFIIGECNRLAQAAGHAIAKNPGGTAYNPLTVYGSVGLGKTHIIQAIGNEILSNFPDKNVLYTNAEKFTNQIIQGIKNNSINDVSNYYQMVDVLIIDDIQFFANKQKTQEIFFHLFNNLHQAGKQIIISSDKAPKDLDGIEERLISRFKWGLNADLQSPDFETRMAILESKISKEEIEIDQRVKEFICFNIKSNIRELEGVLISLIAQASLNHKTIDMALAKDVVIQYVTQVEREITVESVTRIVAEHFKVQYDRLLSKSRLRVLVNARQLSMHFAKHLTKKSLKQIGEFFGGKDHTTVIHSLRAVQNQIDTDKSFRDTVEELEKKIVKNLGKV